MKDTPWQVRIVEWNSPDGRAAATIRRKVFVIEQEVPEDDEWDGLDEGATHFLAAEDPEHPIGTGRLHIIDREGGVGKICRIAVLREARGRGVGIGIVRAIITEARRRGLKRLVLHSQTYAIEFYERLGFRPFGPEFLESNIPHRAMDIEL